MAKIELVEQNLSGSRKQLYNKLKSSRWSSSVAIADESLTLRDS